jgi:hypothetical protein
MILEELEEIEAKLDSLFPPPPPDLVGGFITFEGESMSDITVPAGTASVKAVATFTDANLNAGVPATPPVWASSDESLATVAPDPADTTGQTADVSLAATDSAVSVTVTSTATNADCSTDVLSAAINVEAAVPPPAPDLVGGDIAFTVGG